VFETSLLDRIRSYKPVLWINGKRDPRYSSKPYSGPAHGPSAASGVVSAGDLCGAEKGITEAEVNDAEARLERFAPFIASAFRETVHANGIIESPLYKIDGMAEYLNGLSRKVNRPSCRGPRSERSGAFPLNLYLKADHRLPISGSIKARGGFYEVLKLAEDLASEHGLIDVADSSAGLRACRMSRGAGKKNYRIFDGPEFRDLFSRYRIVVGSTGNLGLSIGIMGTRLGFKVEVHMAAEAKQWKKELLRSRGAAVIEHRGDYSAAVAEGRRQAEADPRAHFVDDENSRELFLGYAVAALRLEEQLAAAGVEVSAERPLFVYLPCGVGGGPGGIAWGLKLVYGEKVYPFFAEPTHAPCMLLGLMTGRHSDVSVFDFGLDSVTEADGLAVGRASGFAGKLVEPFLSGSYTVEDGMMFRLLAALYGTEGIALEPSAAPGLIGPVMLRQTAEGRSLLEGTGLGGIKLEDAFRRGTHIAWATGGGMVPESDMQGYIDQGREFGGFPLRV
jgi:D-serine dehydratase